MKINNKGFIWEAKCVIVFRIFSGRQLFGDSKHLKQQNLTNITTMKNIVLVWGSSVAVPTDQAEERLCGVGLTCIQQTIKCYMKHGRNK